MAHSASRHSVHIQVSSRSFSPFVGFFLDFLVVVVVVDEMAVSVVMIVSSVSSCVDDDSLLVSVFRLVRLVSLSLVCSSSLVVVRSSTFRLLPFWTFPSCFVRCFPIVKMTILVDQ